MNAQLMLRRDRRSMIALFPCKVAVLRAFPLCALRNTVIAAASSWCALTSIALAASTKAESPRSTSDPSSLAAELNAELQLVYRDSLPEFTRRSEQLRHAIDAWNASPKSAANQSQITAWLHDAIHVSMPGSAKPLPPLPIFANAETKAEGPSAAQSVLVAKPVAPRPSTDKPPVAAPPLTSEPSPAKTVERDAPKEASAAQDSNEFWKAHPELGDLPADLTKSDPFQDDPSPDRAGTADTQPIPASPKPAATESSTPDSVHIRLDELGPRIQGYEMALRGIDAKLIADHPSTAELVELSGKLDQLVEQQQFLSLYVGSLTPEEQRSVPILRGFDATTRLLAQRVAERQAAIRGNGSTSDSPASRKERETLDQLASALKQSLAMHSPAK